MGIMSDLFGGGNLFPDYRDVILFNGILPYRATGKFKGNLIEFEQFNNPAKLIYFNTNLTKQQYIERHNKFELYRNKDLHDFIGHEVVLGGVTYMPTGRWFESNQGHLYELMKIDDPTDVMYYGFPFTDDNWIIGKQCLSVILRSRR